MTYIRLPSQRSLGLCIQCNQIWRKFATLEKINSLVILEGFLVLGKIP